MSPAVPDHHRVILNDHLFIEPWMDAQLSRLPGVKPLGGDPWILRDDAYAPQMAYRDDLLETRRDLVFACNPSLDAACSEVLESIAHDCGFQKHSGHFMRPDGISVDSMADHPLVTAGRLTQMDICVLRDSGGEYRLEGAVLCFPSSWTLSQKMGRGLSAIHGPVDDYNDKISISVNRMLSALHPGRPLWRANTLIYTDPDLHQPRREGEHKVIDPSRPRYVRVERQTFVKLPMSGLIIFGIHTMIVPASTLSPDSLSALATIRPAVQRPA